MKSLNRDFLRFLIARAVCIIGDEASIIAVSLKVKSHGSLAIAILLSSLSISMILYSVFLAKYLVRFSFKSILVATSIFQTICSLVMISQNLQTILIANLFLGFGQAILLSHSSAWMTELIRPNDVKKGYGILQTTYAMSTALGLLLGGVLVELFSYNFAITLNAMSFFVAVPVFLNIRNQETTKHKVINREERMSNLNGFRRSSTLRTLAANLIPMIILIRIFNPLEIFIVTDKLKGSASTFGIINMLSAFSLALGSALFTRKVAINTRLIHGLFTIFTYLGITFVAMSIATTIWQFTLMSILFYILISAINVIVGPIIFQHSDEGSLARNHATMNAILASAKIIGIFLGGFLGNIFQPSSILFVSGILIASWSISRIIHFRMTNTRV